MKYEGIEIGELTPFDALFLRTVRVEWLELEEMAPSPRRRQGRRARSISPAVWPQTKDDDSGAV
jgi:hypothetical protein